ncbi:hypothetical protein D3C71_1813090 [compost metagenome]
MVLWRIQIKITIKTSNYGFLWWIEKDGFSASGAGGSLIRVIPAQQIVVVFQTRHLKRFKDPRDIIERYIKTAVY